jgi:hypothetical protein
MKEGINIFISHSHTDSPLVSPIVKLLRINQSFVFQDSDTITPGKKWRDELMDHLNLSDLVIVFWCRHADQSTEVSNEWNRAIEQDKDVLPILLDATPLPPRLGHYQWIDFQNVVDHHSGFDKPAPTKTHPLPQPKRKAKFSLWWILIAVSILVLGFFSLSLLSLDRFIFLPIAVLITLAIIGLIWWGKRRKGSDRTQVYPELAEDHPPPSPRFPGKQPIDRSQESSTKHMASEIEKEILRRKL